MVLDYRALNKVTVKDFYPMPRIQDVTDVLQGNHWLTGMDYVQAFHQILMADERSEQFDNVQGPKRRFVPVSVYAYGSSERNGNVILDSSTRPWPAWMISCFDMLMTFLSSQNHQKLKIISPISKKSSNSLRKTASRSKHPSSNWVSRSCRS